MESLYVNGFHESSDSGVDGDDGDPIVICGFSIKFPDTATNSEGLWQMLVDKRCVTRAFPRNRLNAEGFYRDDNKASSVRRHFSFPKCDRVQDN